MAHLIADGEVGAKCSIKQPGEEARWHMQFIILSLALVAAMPQITESSFEASLPVARGHAEIAGQEAGGTDEMGNLVHAKHEKFDADMGDGNFVKHSSFSSSFHSAPADYEVVPGPCADPQ